MTCASCMQFRTSTREAKRDFAKNGIALNGAVIQTESRQLNFVWTGDKTKPNLLLVHGSPGSWDNYTQFLKDSLLLEHYRIIAVDRPGFGYSDFGAPCKTLKEQAEAIKRVMDSLDNGLGFYLAGHSLGGPVIVEIAAHYPNSVKGIALLAASIDPDLEPKEAFRPILLKPMSKLIIPEAIWSSNYEIYYLKDELELQKSLWPKIKCPVVSVHGTADNLVPVENVNYAQNMLDSTVSFEKHIIADQNHFILWNEFPLIRTVLINLLIDDN